MPKVCLCADDFALNPQVDRAILNLIEHNVLQATTCMTQSPLWVKDSLNLKKYVGKVDLGLHFNLTHRFDTQTYSYPIKYLMLHAWTHQLDKKLIRRSLEFQWNQFIRNMGQPPDFIDGHQHIHQFPTIREVLMDFLQEQNFKGWVRNLDRIIYVSPYRIKSQLLHLLGAKRFAHLCQRAGISQNQQFAGIYDFSDIQYQTLFQQWFAQAEDQLLIMCHPAIAVSNSDDPIQNARIKEYNYLISEQFSQDCQKHNIELSRIGVHDV